MSNRRMKVGGVRRHEVSTRQWLTDCREAKAGLEWARDEQLDALEDAEREGGNAHARERVIGKIAREIDSLNGEIISLENEIATVNADMSVTA